MSSESGNLCPTSNNESQNRQIRSCIKGMRTKRDAFMTSLAKYGAADMKQKDIDAVSQFQEGTLQNSYWKKFGVTRVLLSALAAKTAVPNSRCSNNGGSCDLSIQVTSSGTDRNYEAVNSWYEVGQLRRF
ncbi:hypothetical protein MLD38_013587 [Melastoma candidum]|uniref:Uncharacterized protein n=1 Tax=Melastoma candidum TaxID=119954 RepID=A0ACB9RA23_9MYRT|nr:hypothetical protein MLD38_013587 [Melastoma candidum]